jgi:hypothetical protein
MCSTATGLGRDETTMSFFVKHSLANSQLLSTKAFVAPSLIVNMGPYLSTKAAKVL